MPKAYASSKDTTKHDLKTCEGGYVELRKLTFGESIHRRQLTSSMRMSAGADSNGFVGEMDLTNRSAIEYEFSKCIVSHNLEKDDNGRLFDFSREADIERLDPKVGEEIQDLIRKMNEYDPDLENDEEAQGKLETSSSET